VIRVAFSPDGQHLAAVSADCTVEIWKIRDGALLPKIHDLKGHNGELGALVFSPDSARLVSASFDGTVRIWDVRTGQEVIPPRDTVAVRSLAFSRDGRLLASGGFDRTVKVWSSQTLEVIDERSDPTGGVLSVAFHPQDDRVLAWGSMDGTVKIWNRASKEIRTLRGHTSWIYGVAFSPDGEWIASASQDGTIKLWPVPPLSKAPDQAAEASSD
jgi:WD40 repeat protein